MDKWVIVEGNIIDGVKFIGPFDCESDAMSVTEGLRRGEWIIAPLEEPEIE